MTYVFSGTLNPTQSINQFTWKVAINRCVSVYIHVCCVHERDTVYCCANK